jgi:predicted ATPase
MTELIGRASTTNLLKQALADAVAGRPRLVLLAGEAGIGKTALLDELARQARSEATVAWGPCWEGDGVPGFWPWRNVVNDLAAAGGISATGELALLGSAGDAPALDNAESGRFRLFAAVLDAVRAAAAVRPLLLVFDDLHWADAGSMRLLGFVTRQRRDDQVLVLGAYRDVEVDESHTLRELLAVLPGQAEVVPIEGLVPEQVAELISHSTGEALSNAALADVCRRTGGNPFFLHQLAPLLASTSGDPIVPAAVGQAIERRLGRLPPSCAAILPTAAVIGGTFDAELVAAATGTPSASVADALEPAVRARLVTLAKDGYRFEHDLVRETLLDSVSLQQRRVSMSSRQATLPPPTLWPAGWGRARWPPGRDPVARWL